jgi:hypothetical protein
MLRLRMLTRQKNQNLEKYETEELLGIAHSQKKVRARRQLPRHDGPKKTRKGEKAETG